MVSQLVERVGSRCCIGAGTVVTLDEVGEGVDSLRNSHPTMSALILSNALVLGAAAEACGRRGVSLRPLPRVPGHAGEL